MKWLLAWFAVAVLASGAAGGGAAAADARLGWFTRDLPTPSNAFQVAEQLRVSLTRPGLQLLPTPVLLQLLRRHDEKSGLAARAARLIAQGKQQHLGMELDLAAASFRQAAQLLSQGFFRYHEPPRLAEPLLLLGVVLLEAGRRQDAAKAFGQALNLVPELHLSEAYYSPRVRRLMAEVRTKLGQPRPALLSPAEAERICEALELAGLVTFAGERLGEQPVLRVGLYEHRLHGYRRLEAVVVNSAAATAAELAQRLGSELAAVAGLPAAPEAIATREAGDGGSDGAATAPAGRSRPDAGLPPTTAVPGTAPSLPAAEAAPAPPWYWRHWWIWPLAAAVLSAAVALPLTVFRHDVVRIEVH